MVQYKCRDAGVDLDVTIEKAPKRFIGTFSKNQNRYEQNKDDYKAAVKLISALTQE